MAAAWQGWSLWASLSNSAQGELYTPTHKAGFCTFYEECGKNPELSGGLTSLSNISCLSNTPARHVTGDHSALLQRVCPRLYNGPNDTYACCSTKQSVSLDSSSSITKALLTRCPACSENFVSIHCHNTCSPDQSLFINVTRVVQRDPGQLPAVVAYEAFYQRSFAEKAYESCSRVRIPAAASSAVGSMCGVYGSALCNAQRWLNFQGDTGNGSAPSDITFHLLEPGQASADGMKPSDGKITPCNESQGEDSAACSCQDCAASCPVIPPPPASRPSFYMGRMPGWSALIIIFTAVFVLLSVVLVYLRVASNRNKNKTAGSQEAPNLPRKRRFSPHTVLGRFFESWGTRVASWPLTVLASSFIVVIALSVGSTFIELTTDPVESWSAPKSQARKEKAFHDEHFGPFFRTNQIFVTAKNRSSYKYDSSSLGPKNFSGILSSDLSQESLELQERLRHSQVWSHEAQRNISLQDICYAPLKPHNTSLTDCCVNSLLQYFQNNHTLSSLTANQTSNGQTSSVDWKDHFLYCANAPLTYKDGTASASSCIADYGAPVFPFLAVGGYQGTDYSEAEASIITFSINNYPADDPRMAHAKLWEEAFLKEMQSFQRSTADKFQIAFSAERSSEDEINRTTIQDSPVFAISYLIVFSYISSASGSYSRWSRVAVDSKATSGLGGVAVVSGAVVAAMGFYSYSGVPSSSVIIQVVPFSVSAVGADNIFIFVLEYQRSPRMPGEQREAHIGRTSGSVAPSMSSCSLSEAICFFLGASTSMPAVRTFALTSGLAIIFDFSLQMTAFVASLSSDSKRQEASRPDVVCCFSSRNSPPPKQKEGLLLCFFRKIYTPFSSHRFIRPVVSSLFSVSFGANLYLMCNISVGSDQDSASPKDSYSIDYFLFSNRYLEVGPPVYFDTTSGYNFSTEAGMNAICSSAGCESFSLTQKIQYASEFPNQSYVAIAASSWVDDFIDWSTPSSSCCRIYTRGPHKDEFCPSTDTSFNCLKNCMNRTSGPVRPTTEQFHKYSPWFSNDTPNIRCPKGGLAAYRTSVNLSSDGQIIASQFMAYHKPLRNSQDFTEALRASRLLAANITAELRKVPGTDPNFEVFPYTISNVFYQQYSTVLPEGIFTLALCFVPTFVVCYLLSGSDIRSGILNSLSIIMILVDTIGLMAVWGISYNAVSLINLVTAVGMSVEFVSHITRSFAVSTKPTRSERAKDATIFMGSAVFAGVAMTNFPGILISGFAQAQLIQIFFFRLNLSITLSGSLHGSVFSPVVLSYSGPDVNQASVSEEKLATEAAMVSEPSCPQYPFPADANTSDYVNYGFNPEFIPEINAASSSSPKSDQKF